METSPLIGKVRSYIGLSVLLLALIVIAWVCLSSDLVVRCILAYTRHALVDGVKVGMPKAEVISRLGQPRHVARSASEFWGKDMYAPIPKRPVEKEVLEYTRFVWKLYVYIDDNDRVSYLFVANT